MASAIRFKQSNVPRQNGELARVKVVQGPDYGCVYVITGDRASMGRAEDNDMVISDLKSSRHHLAISRGMDGWMAKDLGSANGIQVNQEDTRSEKIKTGDLITLGETTFEFFESDVPNQLLSAPGRSPGEIAKANRALEEHRDNVRAIGQFGSAGGLALPNAGGSGGMRKILIWGFVIVGSWIAMSEDPLPFMGGDQKAPIKKAKTKSNRNPERDLASYLPLGPQNADLTKTVKFFFKSGFREFREKNFLRAKKQFETALQIDPTHRLSKIYLNNCLKEIDDEVKFHLSRGKRNFKAGKLGASKGHFETVLRLLYKDQASPNYIEANDQLDEIQKAMKGEATL